MTAFKSTDLSRPSATIKGTLQFSQLGADVTLASYDNNDVIVASATAADGVDGLKQTGIVQLFQIISGHVDVGRPIMTISGDRQLARFGANVLVYKSRSDGLDHVVVSAPSRSESLLDERESGRVYEFFGTTADVSASQANVTYLVPGVIHSRFGSSVTVLNSLNNQQLLIGSAHYSLDSARLAGTLAVIQL